MRKNILNFGSLLKAGILCLMGMLVNPFIENLCANPPPAPSFGYKVAQKFHLPGNDGWDYLKVDTTLNRIFVSHGTQVQVIQEADGKLLGAIPNTIGVHGIALAPLLNKGFISNGKDSSITIFNFKTLETIKKVHITGLNPDAIIYDPFSKSVFAFNGKTSNTTVIDATTNEIVATIPLEGKPEEAVSNEKGKIYLNLEDKSQVVEIDALTHKVTGKWSMAPGESPSGIAIDLARQRLFSVCENKLMVVFDLNTHKVLQTVAIGDRVDGAAFDPIFMRVFASNGEGTLTIVQTDSKGNYGVVQNLITQKGARTITLDPRTHHLYLPTANFGDTPAPTVEKPKPRPAIKPNTFAILDVTF